MTPRVRWLLKANVAVAPIAHSSQTGFISQRRRNFCARAFSSSRRLECNEQRLTRDLEKSVSGECVLESVLEFDSKRAGTGLNFMLVIYFYVSARERRLKWVT